MSGKQADSADPEYFVSALNEQIESQIQSVEAESDKKALRDVQNTINNASAEEILEAQDLRTGLKDLKDSYFALVSKALRSFVERMFTTSEIEINDRTIKRDCLLKMLPKTQTCHTQDFYNKVKGCKSRLYISVNVCEPGYSFEEQMKKIEDTKSFPDDRAESIKKKENNGRFALNGICSRLISAVNIFWKEFYLTNKIIIDKLTGDESQRLTYDPANVTFALDDTTKIGLHFMIEQI